VRTLDEEQHTEFNPLTNVHWCCGLPICEHTYTKRNLALLALLFFFWMIQILLPWKLN